MTPADYASTSGIILRLQDEVWVNAPIAEHNANFVRAPRTLLDVDGTSFFVAGFGLESLAWVCLPPLYHDRTLSTGRPATHFAFSHGDRVRLSPIRGCAMRCKFCNVPYDDPYETKPVDGAIEALQLAFDDPLQPAHHVMISGGTPAARDIPYLRQVYEQVLESARGFDVDIMMVPVRGLFDLPRLKALGLHQLSVNVELFSEKAARDLMPQKHRFGTKTLVDFIRDATHVLGPASVRSILMVGIEPATATLDGVRAILDAGGVPVLSPFRPDPATPLRDASPPSADLLEEVFSIASELAVDAGIPLGPHCPPCTHNTLTFASLGSPAGVYPYSLPVVV
ncbi:MAG: radical SAM protein [Acidobacteriota bacterium]